MTALSEAAASTAVVTAEITIGMRNGIWINLLYESEIAVMIAVMAKPATNQGITSISFQKNRNCIRGEHLLARHIIREKREMELTEKVGSYGWELKLEAVSSVWLDWPWSTLRAAVAPATNMTTSSKARASATVVTADPTRGARKNGIGKTSFKKSKKHSSESA